MPGYLLDTNHLSAFAQDNPTILKKLAELPPDVQLRVCVITLGESEAGHRITESTNQEKRDAYTAYINRVFLPNAIPVTGNTRLYYADIIGRVWTQHPPQTRRRRTEAHLVSLGIDVNDIWITAVALEHKFILVTNDKMTIIKEVVSEIKFENWL